MPAPAPAPIQPRHMELRYVSLDKLDLHIPSVCRRAGFCDVAPELRQYRRGRLVKGERDESDGEDEDEHIEQLHDAVVGT